MNRVCKGLMTVFRIVQLILSLAALFAGACITHEMFSMASTAHQVESTIEVLLNVTQRQEIEAKMGATFTDLHLTDREVGDFVLTLDEILAPVLHVMEETPVRAIILSVVSFWSICFIVYLFFAQRATHNTWVNKRSIRVSFEFLTLLLWVAGIVCASLLAIEYGGVVLAGGVELKVAWSTIEAIVTAALKKLYEDGNPIIAMSVVEDVIMIGAVSIVAVSSACICGVVSLVSLIMACCISGKSKTKHKDIHLERGVTEQLMPLAAEKKIVIQVSETPSPGSWYTAMYQPVPHFDSAG